MTNKGEYRLGSLISQGVTGKYRLLNWKDLRSIALSKDPIFNVESKDLRPISLLEGDIMGLLGFKKCGCGGWKSEKMEMHLDKEMRCGDSQPILYVHQLQNMHYILHGIDFNVNIILHAPRNKKIRELLKQTQLQNMSDEHLDLLIVKMHEVGLRMQFIIDNEDGESDDD